MFSWIFVYEDYMLKRKLRIYKIESWFLRYKKIQIFLSR